jgi:hypothetical protein
MTVEGLEHRLSELIIEVEKESNHKPACIDLDLSSESPNAMEE